MTLEHQIIPDRISLPGIIICFIFSFFVPWVTPLESAIGILAGGGILYIFAEGYHFLTKKEGMGGGDIKLLAMIGAFLGWKGALTSFNARSLYRQLHWNYSHHILKARILNTLYLSVLFFQPELFYLCYGESRLFITI